MKKARRRIDAALKAKIALEALREQATVADLAHVDATIRLFASAMEPETIPAKRIRQSDLRFEPGGLSRRVLDALRRADAPIRAPDLVRFCQRSSLRVGCVLRVPSLPFKQLPGYRALWLFGACGESAA